MPSPPTTRRVSTPCATASRASRSRVGVAAGGPPRRQPPAAATARMAAVRRPLPLPDVGLVRERDRSGHAPRPAARRCTLAATLQSSCNHPPVETLQWPGARWSSLSVADWACSWWSGRRHGRACRGPLQSKQVFGGPGRCSVVEPLSRPLFGGQGYLSVVRLIETTQSVTGPSLGRSFPGKSDGRSNRPWSMPPWRATSSAAASQPNASLTLLELGGPHQLHQVGDRRCT